MRARIGQRARSRGQSMLEAIIASGIIATAVAASLTLTQSAISGGKTSETTIVGVNLAREGVEVARQIRDANWLRGDRFDLGLVATGYDYTGVPVFDATTGTWHVDFAADDFTAPETFVYRYAADSGAAVEGLYVQDAPQPAGTVPTGYRRLLTLTALCDDGAGGYAPAAEGAGCGPDDADKVGVQVTSEVRWQVSGRPRSEKAELTLLDWR